MTKMDDLTKRLRKRAYDQGYRAGQRGLPFNLADWEPEFRANYQRGFNDGRSSN